MLIVPIVVQIAQSQVSGFKAAAYWMAHSYEFSA